MIKCLCDEMKWGEWLRHGLWVKLVDPLVINLKKGHQPGIILDRWLTTLMSVVEYQERTVSIIVDTRQVGAVCCKISLHKMAHNLKFMGCFVSGSFHLVLLSQGWLHMRAQRQRICLPVQETQETHIWSLCWKDPLEESVATYSSILAWRIP